MMYNLEQLIINNFKQSYDKFSHLHYIGLVHIKGYI